MLAPRHVRALGGKIPAPKTSTESNCSEGGPILTPNRKMLLNPSQLFFLLGSLGTASAPQLFCGPASTREEGHNEKLPWPDRQRRGQDPIPPPDPSPLATKLNCTVQKQEQGKLRSASLKQLWAVPTDVPHSQSSH